MGETWGHPATSIFFPCFHARVVFSFFFHYSQVMRLPRPVQRAFDMLAPELRRIADAVGTIHVDTQQRTEAINAAQESQRRQKDIAPLWIENIVTKYEQVERDKATADERHYRVQNSLKRATWCAFFAASFYGAVAVFQWWTMHTTYQEIQKQTAAAQCAARAATDAAKTAKESLVSVQRAFVFLPLADKGYTGDLVGPQHSIAELPFVLGKFRYDAYKESPIPL